MGLLRGRGGGKGEGPSPVPLGVIMREKGADSIITVSARWYRARRNNPEYKFFGEGKGKEKGGVSSLAVH